jgi:hypothetical protein
MRRGVSILLLLFSSALYCQDTTYARQVIRFLTSDKCFGRGYVKNGLSTAAEYITGELQKEQMQPLFNGGYYQYFNHSVNTFPGPCQLWVNGRRLRTGFDFIPFPGSKSCRGKFHLVRTDSTHFAAKKNGTTVTAGIQNKLTFSVAAEQENCGINILRSSLGSEPSEIKLKIRSRVVKHFKSANIGCVMRGETDTMLVFSAHYDHLGGIGATWFPGANDNASGVSMLLNLVKYFHLHPSRYTMVFIFFAGEEAGLLGSKYFSESNAISLNKIKFLINLDLLGTGDDGIMVVNGAVFEKEFQLMNRINAEQNLVKEIRKRGKAANSDHYWFTEAGVPSFFIYTLGGTKAYHDVYDVEKTLPLTDYMDILRLITSFASQL